MRGDGGPRELGGGVEGLTAGKGLSGLSGRVDTGLSEQGDLSRPRSRPASSWPRIGPSGRQGVTVNVWPRPQGMPCVGQAPDPTSETRPLSRVEERAGTGESI